MANRLDAGYVPITGTASGLDETRVITQARVRAYQGFFCLRQGLHPQSKELLERSLAILRPLSACGSLAARDALSNTLAFLGMLTVSLGDYPNGNRFLNEGLEIKRANKDGLGIAFCLRQLGVLGFYQGAYDGRPGGSFAIPPEVYSGVIQANRKNLSIPCTSNGAQHIISLSEYWRHGSVHAGQSRGFVRLFFLSSLEWKTRRTAGFASVVNSGIRQMSLFCPLVWGCITFCVHGLTPQEPASDV